MKEEFSNDPLSEWNKLARENAENAIVSSMFRAISNASEPIETFTTWLMAGSAAIAAFIIGNNEKIIPTLGKTGFILAGASLSLSCLFGLLSKIYALQHRIAFDTGNAVEATILNHIARHEVEAREIQRNAESQGFALESSIRMERVMNEFLRPMPWWVRWGTMRHLKKHGQNPQIAHVLRIRTLIAQSLTAFLQALSFLLFLWLGFAYAAGHQ